MPEPWAPVTATCHRPSRSSRMPRWYSVRPGCFFIAVSLSAAKWMGAATGDTPISVSSASRAKKWKVTMVATGLPGRPNSNVLRSPLPSFPKAIGRPGFMAIFQNVISPRLARISRTKSASPTDTPPLVMIASTSPTADSSAADSASRVSRATPRSTTSQPSRVSMPVSV